MIYVLPVDEKIFDWNPTPYKASAILRKKDVVIAEGFFVKLDRKAGLITVDVERVQEKENPS